MKPTANKTAPVRPGQSAVFNPESIASCPEVPWSRVHNCKVMETVIVMSPAIQAIRPMVLAFGAFIAEFVFVGSLVVVLTELTVLDICYY